MTVINHIHSSLTRLAAPGPQHQPLGAHGALLAPDASLAHALPRHLLAVGASRAEERTAARWVNNKHG